MNLQMADGRAVEISHRTCPVPVGERPPLLAFWRAEWKHTDLDWDESLRGAYSDSLTIRLVTAMLGGRIVGAASVMHAKASPEICVIADVLTAPEFRGQGIAARLADEAVRSGFADGCRVAYLGNIPMPRSVYERIGFTRLRGVVMRRSAPGQADCETQFYEKGQAVSVRPAAWGDLPGVACLMAQPLQCRIADHARGLVTPTHSDPTRCVSNFTKVWYEMKERAGVMLTLMGATPHRVLGFGSLTTDPSRRSRAVVDAIAHDHHPGGMDLLIRHLIAEARSRRSRVVRACVAREDEVKARHFSTAGFQTVGMMLDNLRSDGGFSQVSLMELALISKPRTARAAKPRPLATPSATAS